MVSKEARAKMSETRREWWAKQTEEKRKATGAQLSRGRREWWAALTVEEQEAYSTERRGKKRSPVLSLRGEQRTDAQKASDAARRTGKWVPCANCGTAVYRTPLRLRNSKNAYCSRPCSARASKQQPSKPRRVYICPVCDTEFERLPSREKYAKVMYCSPRCAWEACSGEGHPNWTGGRQKRTDGYIDLSRSLVPEELRCMCRKEGKVFEHRLIMAQHLGRPLKASEVVHHKNHIRDDNRIENLELYPHHTHTSLTQAEQKIAELEKQIAALKEQLNER